MGPQSLTLVLKYPMRLSLNLPTPCIGYMLHVHLVTHMALD
uniref:Uncharacterized protein n=1 Tax=Anguilla anguilla TaxID=7936 RepID=A0A0E9WFK4_ANGAN